MSARLQRLAATPEEDVQRYFAMKRARGEVFSMSELLRMATRLKKRRKRLTSEDRPTMSGWQGTVDAISRVAAVDLCIGMSPPKGWKNARAANEPINPEHLKGVVFAAPFEGGEKSWLTRLHAARRAGAVTDAFVFVRAATGERWFKCFEEGWLVAFTLAISQESEPHLVAYHGDKRHAFALVFRTLGSVMTSSLAREQ